MLNMLTSVWCADIRVSLWSRYSCWRLNLCGDIASERRQIFVFFFLISSIYRSMYLQQKPVGRGSLQGGCLCNAANARARADANGETLGFRCEKNCTALYCLVSPHSCINHRD